MKIISLVDDRKTDNQLMSEHGLSFYAETDSKKYLFDTGASEKFIKNANRLGLKIKDIDALFISHNHYDHMGGLLYFMEVNKRAIIYIKEDSIYNTFYKHDYIQCPVGKYHKELAECDRVVFVKDSMQVDNIHLVSDTNNNRKYLSQDNKFFMDKCGKIIPDEFSHEMFLVYINDGKANVISACSHRGIVNIIETAKNTFNLPINNVVAGLHLTADGGLAMNCTDDYYLKLAQYLYAENAAKIYTCHCTGKYAYKKLKKDLGDKIDYFYLGSTIKI